VDGAKQFVTEAQFLVITQLLAEIRDTTRVVLAMFLPDDPAETDECQHPDENRVPFATAKHPAGWVCSLCKFDPYGVMKN
jgi:hypothetical protein